jgi:hypothetical protein
MAYVGITEKLKGDVKNKIAAMMEAELTQMVPEFPRYPLPRNNPEVMKALWGEYVELAAQMPDQWKDVCTYVTFKFSDVEVQTIAKTGQEFRGPANVTRYEKTVKLQTTDNVELLELCRRKRIANDIVHKWDEAKRKVIGFLEAAKSLNEALKLWPQLALYIPEKYLEAVAVKIDKKKEGSKAAALLVDMEVDQLTAHAVGARMTK